MTQSPSACVGESITVSCVLNVPNSGDMFVSTLTGFILGSSNDSISESVVDGTSTVNMVDLSRFTADTPIGNNTRVTGSITLLSYQTSDEDLRVGCRNDFIPSEGSSTTPFFETLRLKQASKFTL